MDRELVLRHLVEIKPGVFFRLSYETEPPVKAAFRNNIKVVKHNEVTLRTGVKYTNINGVVPSEKQRENNYEWIIPHKASHNRKTGKDYLNVATCKHNANPHTVYLVNGNEMSKEELQERGYLINSYWNSSDVKVMNISFDNIKSFMKGKK